MLGNGELKVALTVKAHKFYQDRHRKDRGRGRQGGGSSSLRMFHDPFKNIWSIPELRGRVMFTLAMLAVYRVGSHIPTPGIDCPGVDAVVRAAAGLDSGIRRSVLRVATSVS